VKFVSKFVPTQLRVEPNKVVVFMKNFFENLFKKEEDNNENSIVSFDVLNPIYTYLTDETSSFDFKMKGIHGEVSVNLYTFPGSFYNEEAQKGIKEAGFSNPHEILNELYNKVNISAVSDQDIEQGFEYDYMHINFYSEPPPEIRKMLKHVMQNFIIFFSCEDNSEENNTFRILYSTSYFFDYTKGLLECKFIDANNPETEMEEIAFKDFKLVLQGINQYLKIKMPQNIALPSAEDLIQDSINVDHFRELLRLISRGDLNEEELNEQAEELFENFGIDEDDEDDEDYDYSFNFLDGVNHWHSDWKFDAEEAEAIVSDLIDQDFKFDCPEETYSHDLFAYIQAELAKQNLELMSCDTGGDSYLFFVVNKDEVARILELAEITEIGIDKLY
jgi:hypothetical protein